MMASVPITSQQIEGEKVEAMIDFILLGSPTTAASDCSHEIKRLAPWKESYDKPRQHIKRRDITLLIKVCIVKAVDFTIIKYRCENWTKNKVEH